jgi:hypothetical protein
MRVANLIISLRVYLYICGKSPTVGAERRQAEVGKAQRKCILVGGDDGAFLIISLRFYLYICDKSPTVGALPGEEAG